MPQVRTFSLFLTPVFFFVLQWVTDRRGTALPEVDGETLAFGHLAPAITATG